MRYFYIICLVLSSFFIYNLSSADNIGRQYAFFIPGNAYQKNTEVNDLNSMRTRYKKTEIKDNTDSISVSKNKTTKMKTTEKLTRPVTKKPLTEIADTEPTPQIKKQETVTEQSKTIKDGIPTITADTSASETNTPAVTTQLPSKEADAPVEVQLSQEELDKIKEKAAQYNIDEDDEFIIAPASPSKTAQQEEKSINSLLSAIPYPSPDEPNFKQAFGKYGITLRTLYRKKEMPADYEQDRILAKATSMKRFKVEAAN